VPEGIKDDPGELKKFQGRTWPLASTFRVYVAGGEWPVPLRKSKKSGKMLLRIVRKISSSYSIMSAPYVCSDWGLGTWAKGSVALILASESASLLPGIPVWPGTHKWYFTNPCLHQPETYPGSRLRKSLKPSCVQGLPTLIQGYVSSWRGHSFKSHSQPFFLTFPELI